MHELFPGAGDVVLLFAWIALVAVLLGVWDWADNHGRGTRYQTPPTTDNDDVEEHHK